MRFDCNVENNDNKYIKSLNLKANHELILTEECFIIFEKMDSGNGKIVFWSSLFAITDLQLNKLKKMTTINFYDDELNSEYQLKLKIDNIGSNDGNYKKERQTKITRLPDGGKEIEITEKTQIEVERPPSIRGSRYRYSKNSKNTNEEENNNEDVKSQTRGTYYKVRRPRGNDNNNNNEEKRVSISKVEVEENNDVIIPKRYHRRYRDNKVSTNNDN